MWIVLLYILLVVYGETVLISTSNHMFKRENWDKFTEFTFLKFWILEILRSFDFLKILKFWDFKISKNERDKFSQNVTNKYVIPG